jgi:hypothetical protein
VSAVKVPLGASVLLGVIVVLSVLVHAALSNSSEKLSKFSYPTKLPSAILSISCSRVAGL